MNEEIKALLEELKAELDALTVTFVIGSIGRMGHEMSCKIG